MGSWDACCGISKLPIGYGDPVVDFFIGEVGKYRKSGFICYINDLWTPIAIQTYGTYDDYGQIAPEHGWHTDYVVNVLRQHAVELEQGENTFHDIPIKRDTLTFAVAQNAIHEGRLYVAQPGWVAKDGIGVRVSRMMMHRFVFDELVSWGIDSWYLKTDLTGLVRLGIEEVAKAHDDESKDAARGLMNRVNLPDRQHKGFFGGFRDSESGDYYVPHRFKNYMGYLLDNATAANITEIITEVAKYMIVRSRMHEMQFLWTPQIGSQDRAYESLSKLYRLCDTYARRKGHADEEELA